MKKRFVSLLLLGFAVSSCSENTNVNIPGLSTFESKGPVTEKEHVMEFDEIEVEQSISAEVVKSEQEKIVVSAPSDMHEKIVLDNESGKLNIHFQPGIKVSSEKVKVIIYARDFSSLEANSSATINVKDKFTQDKTSLKASSSGTISGNLEANDFSVDVSSSGAVQANIWAVDLDVEASSSGVASLTGKAKNVKADVSSSGAVDAKSLHAENADLEASSSGSIVLNVSGKLKYSANSSGTISVMKNGDVQVLEAEAKNNGSFNFQN